MSYLPLSPKTKLEDLGDDDIALGPHLEVITCDCHQIPIRFSTETGHSSLAYYEVNKEEFSRTQNYDLRGTFFET